MLHAGFLLSWFSPWRWRWYVLIKITWHYILEGGNSRRVPEDKLRPASGPYPEWYESSTYPPILFKIHFNIIVPSMPMYSKCSLSSGFHTKTGHWISHKSDLNWSNCDPVVSFSDSWQQESSWKRKILEVTRIGQTWKVLHLPLNKLRFLLAESPLASQGRLYSGKMGKMILPWILWEKGMML